MQRPNPEDYQPPLSWWRHGWRLLLCVVISAIVWPQFAPEQLDVMPVLFWLDLGVGLASYVVVLGRRRWPVAVAVATNAMAVVSGVAAGPATLAAVSMATRRRLLPILVTSLVAVVASMLYTELEPSAVDDPFWISLTATVIAVAASMGWGMYIGSRRELLWTLRHRAERAEAEQELRVGQARGQERSRIAREMHDVLAHRISQISLHAGALTFRDDLTAADMRASAEVIQTTAHQALTDLRTVLGVLRDDEGNALDAPQPTYADLRALVADAEAAGLRVEYADDVRAADGADGVPDALGRALYRIVQEGITNARKHAPGATLLISLSGSPDDGIAVELRNRLGFAAAAAPPGAGLGLVGLSERAALRGGRLEHRRDADAFVLRGWLPWAA
ncbi:sensor histidine kinase [Nocardioides kribbensis]|uniref:histidine kinase n=1 Tax=Nocardioides kribbensis TaxID=305517 RepID=A0ABV1P1K0_9ACTN